jgi:DNA-binding transcriptional ArsR family regulator
VPTRKAQGIELLADPTRRRIVALVARRVRHPSDIADALGLSRPATSRQLRLLTEARLLRWDRSMFDGRSRAYRLDPLTQESITAWLAGVDMRTARPVLEIRWSPPARAHSLRREAAALDVDLDGSA